MAGIAPRQLMRSRIFVDVRGDGAVIANHLRQLGFVIEEFVPLQIRKLQRESDFPTGGTYSGTNGTRHLLSEDDDLFASRNRVSLESANDPLECEQAARLLKMWRQHSPSRQVDK